ncbi:hypothetical protein SUGI_0237190 [Cryptomeria japonica]|nr:hypothetical protein SUGI_0237190 [Cryptomeria japonica]
MTSAAINKNQSTTMENKVWMVKCKTTIDESGIARHGDEKRLQMDTIYEEKAECKPRRKEGFEVQFQTENLLNWPQRFEIGSCSDLNTLLTILTSSILRTFDMHWKALAILKKEVIRFGHVHRCQNHFTS